MSSTIIETIELKRARKPELFIESAKVWIKEAIDSKYFKWAAVAFGVCLATLWPAVYF